MNNLPSVLNLREEIKKECDPDDLENQLADIDNLQYLVLTALLDPSERFRQEALDRISREYPNVIRCFVGDKQIMLKLQEVDDEPFQAYLCDLPNVYSGQPVTKIYPFNLE